MKKLLTTILTGASVFGLASCISEQPTGTTAYELGNDEMMGFSVNSVATMMESSGSISIGHEVKLAASTNEAAILGKIDEYLLLMDDFINPESTLGNINKEGTAVEGYEFSYEFTVGSETYTAAFNKLETPVSSGDTEYTDEMKNLEGVLIIGNTELQLTGNDSEDISKFYLEASNGTDKIKIAVKEAGNNQIIRFKSTLDGVESEMKIKMLENNNKVKFTFEEEIGEFSNEFEYEKKHDETTFTVEYSTTLIVAGVEVEEEGELELQLGTDGEYIVISSETKMKDKK